MHRVAVVAVLLLTISSPAAAQDEGPKAGTWGAENRTDFGGALLRFRSPASAWVLGAAVFFRGVSGDATSSFGTRDQTTVSARLGVRRYQRVSEKTRPYRALSLIVEYSDYPFNRPWHPGAAAEWGVSHFFTPHVSLGISAEASLIASRQRIATFPGPTETRTTVDARFSGFRVNGGVYF